MKNNLVSAIVFSTLVGFSGQIFAQTPAAPAAAVDKAAIAALTQQLAALTTALQASSKAAPAATTPKVVIPKEGTLAEQVRELQAEVALLKKENQDAAGIAGPVYVGGFAHGVIELTPRQKLEIGAVVTLIRAEKPGKVQVIGYASNGGDADKNKELAGKRAENVKKYIDSLLAAAPARVAGAAAPAPVPPVVAPDDVEVYTGGDEGQTAMFSHRLGANALNQAVVVRLVR